MLNEISKKEPAKSNRNYERLLADKGAQLTPVYIDNIAFIYTENKITYIVEYNNEKSSINLTLDELFKSLNENTFYRASRQVIISAKAIVKIEKYGTSQLRVMTNPISPIAIIISKAKITEFKKWAGKS
jgi:DNA-binding LytR/AlgR family response regulator